MAAEEFDAVVIGGGLTGAGVALDAAARGLSVALVERHDFASGMSSRSSKLLDGAPAGERELMLALAPRLVRPLELVLPGGQETTMAAVTDDVRLVLTLIGEAERHGGVRDRLEAVEVVERDGDGSPASGCATMSATGASRSRRQPRSTRPAPAVRRFAAGVPPTSCSLPIGCP